MILSNWMGVSYTYSKVWDENKLAFENVIVYEELEIPVFISNSDPL